MSLVRSAIALFVKDEAHDILGWISWHIAIGIDKIFIYDDHSSDGTFEIALAASKIFDIEVIKTDLSEGNFYNRQRNSYFDAIKRSIGKYQWIALLDGDEYISIGEGPSINEFLKKFDDNKSAIAMSWCIYGSSSRVIKDNVPIYQAYNYHSTKDLGDNLLVKSFVRPERIVFKYENPHKFNIDRGLYVDVNGDEVKWLQGPTKKIIWDSVRVNHYICRSMEHFVGRIKRRIGVDLSNTTSYWEHFNKNDIFEEQNKEIVHKSNYILNKIKLGVFSYFKYNILNVSDFVLRGVKNRNINRIPNFKNIPIFTMKSYHGECLFLNNIDGHVVQKHGATKLIAAKPYIDDRIYLFTYFYGCISNIKFNIFGENRKNYCYDFEMIRCPAGGFFMKSDDSRKFVTALPEISGFIVEVSRAARSHWEEFSFLDKVGEMKVSYDRPGANTSDGIISDIINSMGDYSFEEFSIRASSLSPLEKNKLASNYGSYILTIM